MFLSMNQMKRIFRKSYFFAAFAIITLSYCYIVLGTLKTSSLSPISPRFFRSDNKSEDSFLVLSVWSHGAEFISVHYQSYQMNIKKFGGKLSYLVVISADNDDFFDLREICNFLNLPFIHVKSSTGDASRNHANALNTAVRYVIEEDILKDFNFLIITDGDIIPLDVDYTKSMESSFMAGLPQEREGISYWWPNFLIFRLHEKIVQVLNLLDFSPTTYVREKIIHLDTGGKLTNQILFRFGKFPIVEIKSSSLDTLSVGDILAPWIALFKEQYDAKNERLHCHPGEVLALPHGFLYHIGSASSQWRRNCPKTFTLRRWAVVDEFISSADKCILQKTSYNPSSLEKKWMKYSSLLKPSKIFLETEENEKYCQLIREDLNAMSEIVQYSSLSTTSAQLNESVFSVFIIRVACLSGIYKIKKKIEPIIGLLRDPRSGCEAMFGMADRHFRFWHERPYMLSREFLLLDKVPVHRKKRIMIDLGASSYKQGPGGSSQEFLIQSYKQRGISFDRILMWEKEKVDMVSLLNEVPEEIFSSYQYFNIPITENTSLPKHPINVLRKISTNFDFVTIKLDVDSNHIESSIYAMLLDHLRMNPSFITEFFWEQHDLSMSEQYFRLSELRNLGIRAHAWP